MCGRIAITLPPEAMAQLFNATPANDLPPVPNYNVCPTVNIHTVTSDSGTRHLRSMRWGFLPRWYKKLIGGPLLINARSETIAEKPAFREACRHRRSFGIVRMAPDPGGGTKGPSDLRTHESAGNMQSPGTSRHVRKACRAVSRQRTRTMSPSIQTLH